MKTGRKVWTDSEIEAVARRLKAITPIEMLQKMQKQIRLGQNKRLIGLTEFLHEAQLVLPADRRKPNLEKQGELIARIKDAALKAKVHGVNLTATAIAKPKVSKAKPALKAKIDHVATYRGIDNQLKGLGLELAQRKKILNQVAAASN